MQKTQPPESSSSDWTLGSGSSLTPFHEAIDHVLRVTALLIRDLVGAHQSAAALIVGGDWKGMRKRFSLSSKYSQWFEYQTPAAGFGIHAMPVKQNQPIRLAQAELEAHPEWKGFGGEAGKHPPMRGWLAAPIIGWDGRNYGLLQASDKYNDEEFTAEDEERLMRLAQLTAAALDGISAFYNHHDIGHPPQVR